MINSILIKNLRTYEVYYRQRIQMSIIRELSVENLDVLEEDNMLL
jgi:hypothetical protein